MPDQQAFLDALNAAPCDDTTRLVYADWLDEHAMPQEAEYLRLTVALVPRCHEGDCPEATRLLALADALPAEWRDAAGARFSVVLSTYEVVRKINTIKLIREVTGCGLAEAKAVSEALPNRIVTDVPFERAAAVRKKIAQETSAVVRVHPPDLDLTDLPYRVLHRVTLGYTEQTWHEPPLPPDPSGMVAFVKFVRNYLELSPEEAAARCRSRSVVVAENMTTADADQLVTNLRRRIPGIRNDRLWYFYVNSVPTGAVPTDE